jgi:DNA processing protein
VRFRARNRIIAALAVGTVIVEAGRQSGTMTTALHDIGLGKPVMALPGPVTSAQSAGCHQLIRTGQATCVTDAADILGDIGGASKAIAGPPRRSPG